MFALLPVCLRNALYGEVVGFRGAGDEVYFALLASDQMGNLIARLFDSVFRFKAERVHALSIAVILPEIGKHFFKYPFVNPGICMIFQIDFFHKLFLPIFYKWMILYCFMYLSVLNYFFCTMSISS